MVRFRYAPQFLHKGVLHIHHNRIHCKEGLKTNISYALNPLKPLTTNEFTIKVSFHFTKEIYDQQPDFSMRSLDVDSLFTNIPLQETIEMCTNELFKESKTIEDLIKSEFKELLSLATKDQHFIFDGTFYKQIDGVAMGYPLGPKLANAFLVYHEKNMVRTLSTSIKTTLLSKVR